MKKKLIIALVTVMNFNLISSVSPLATEVLNEVNFKEVSDKVSNMENFLLESHVNFEEYKAAIKIPRSSIKSVSTNGGHYSTSVPERAIDDDTSTHWETRTINSDSFKNEFTVEFVENVNIDKMTYKVRNGLTGFLNEYEIYGSKTVDGDDFELIATGSGESVLNTVEINFEETEVRRVKIVFMETLRGWASITELGFYNDPVMKKVDSIFTDNFHTELSEDYNTLEKLNALELEVENHPFKEEFLTTINSAKDIINGTEVEKSEVITLSQRGNENNDKARIGQRFAGGNLDLTGYYIMPGETFELYLDADEDSVLPQLVFSQVGEIDDRNRNYVVNLKPGKNIINTPIYNGVEFTKGFAIYLTNKALPSEQAYAPKVVLKGDELNRYPIYIDGVTDVADYIEEVRNHTGANMTDLAGERILISARNTEAQIAYIDNDATPKDMIRELTEVIEIYNDISGLDENDPNPLHKPSTAQYHMKFSNEGMLYASNEYTHYSWNTARNMLGGNPYPWGFLHEFAHQMESINMMLGEVTTNIYSMTAQLINGLDSGTESTYESVQVDMIDEFLLTGVGGYYDFTYGGKLMVIYQIINYFGVEAYSNAYRALREDMSIYPTSNREQRFIMVMSDITGYDLSTHFELYNYIVEPETKEFTSQFKPLDKKIEYTRITARDMINENVQVFSDTTKAVIDDIERVQEGFKLTLSTSDNNEGTIAYEIYRDGELVGISRETEFIDTIDSSDPSVVYQYEVVAYDYRVNESIKSEVVTSEIGFKPVINVDKNVILKLNETFNPLDYIEAVNYNDEIIPEGRINIVKNTVDTTKEGIYEVVYEVEDLGFTITETMEVKVVFNYDYASDLNWVSGTTGFGSIKKDQTVSSSNKIKLNIDGEVTEFNKGIATVANSEIVYNVSDSNYDYINAYVGPDENYNYDKTSLIFKVLVDGQEVYQSDLLKNNSEAELINIPIKDAEEVNFVVYDNGDGITGDFAAWADLKFVSTSVESSPEVEVVDKSALTAEITAGELIIAEEYTEESYNAFEVVLNEAKAVLANEDATQEEVNDVLKRLIDLKEALIKVEASNSSIYSIVAPEEAVQLEVNQFELTLGKDVEKVRVTYYWTENGTEKSFVEYYSVKDEGKLTINRALKFRNEYRIEFTPIVNGDVKEEESKSINLSVISPESEDKEIIKLVTGNGDLSSTTIDKVGDSVTFKIETSLDIDKLKFVFETSNNYTEYYSKKSNAEEIDGKLVWTIVRPLRTAINKHEIVISAMENNIVRDSSNYEVNVGNNY